MKLRNNYKTICSGLEKTGVGIGRPIAGASDVFDVTTFCGHRVRNTCCKIFRDTSPAEVEKEYQMSRRLYQHDPVHFMRVCGPPVSFTIEDTIFEGYKKSCYALLMEKSIPFTFAPGPKYVSFYVRFLLDLCQAAQTIHSLGYVHMDISPDNLVINSHGNYCLIDFGTSKKITDMVISLYDLSDSKYFTAPEILKGEFSAQSDIYSIGMTARFVLMNGIIEIPACHADIRQIYMNKGKLVPLGSDDVYTNHFLSIINKATAFSPSDRYKNTDEMLNDLLKFPIENDIKFYSRCYEYDENEAV